MTATTASDVELRPMQGPGWLAANVATVTGRNLRRLVRVPTLIAFATVQPILFVVLFTYAWGGAIHPAGVDRYIDYALPGIWVLSIAFGASQTGVAIADDLSTGMIDRFRALPMARSAVLAGRTTADAIRNLFVLLLMTAVASVIGFRFHAGPMAAFAAVALALAGGVAFSWVFALLGLLVRDFGIRRHRGPARRHPASLHQLHVRARRHLPGLAAGVRERQPDHRPGRRAACPVPGRTHGHRGVAGVGPARRAARRHRAGGRPVLPADHHVMKQPQPRVSTRTVKP